MPYFVEYLRATRALRIAAIILGVLLLFGAGVRLYFWNQYAAVWPQQMIAEYRKSPTAHVTTTKLPDGRTRTVVDDPAKHRHLVVDTDGRNYEVRNLAPAGERRMSASGSIVMGNRNHTERTHDGTTETLVTYNTGSAMQWGTLFFATFPMGLLIATLLGGPLAKENDGHLELAWTKPVSRQQYALAAVAIDVLAILASQILSVVLLIAGTAMWSPPTFALEPDGLAKIALALLAPAAWYACLTAFSASLRRGPGAVIGVGWVVAIIVPGFVAATQAADEPLLRTLHGFFTAVQYADPVAYIWFRGSEGFARFAASDGSKAAWLCGLLLVYVAAAVGQWRRVEA
jgi:hypothetical protein